MVVALCQIINNKINKLLNILTTHDLVVTTAFNTAMDNNSGQMDRQIGSIWWWQYVWESHKLLKLLTSNHIKHGPESWIHWMVLKISHNQGAER